MKHLHCIILIISLTIGIIIPSFGMECIKGITDEATEEETDIEEKWEDVNFDQKYSEPPGVVNLVRPTYPEISKENNIKGDVVLSVYIDKTGIVRNVVVQSSPGLPAMEEKAISAAYKCTFTPAKDQGEPVGVWYSIIMQFGPEKLDSLKQKR